MTPSPAPGLTAERLAEIRARFKVFESTPHRNNATDCAYIDDVGDLLAETDRLKTETDWLNRQADRWMQNCGWCQEDRTESGGFYPCPLHGGAEQGAVGKDEITGRMWFYCPNCTQRTGDDSQPRWQAQVRVSELEAEVERLRTALAGQSWEPTLEAALRKYGNHHSGCTSLTFQDSGRCSCGFSALLDRPGPQEPATDA